MPIEHKLIRCAPDDPRRCQSTGASGQCPYTAMDGYPYCQRHGCGSVKADEKKSVNRYRLQQWQGRLKEFAEDKNITSLRDEIGILRILLEEVTNKCTDSTQLVIYSNKISDLIVKIEKVVVSCNRLETKMGMLLDKSTALNFAGQVVDIISQHVQDASIIDQISSQIIDSLSALTGMEK